MNVEQQHIAGFFLYRDVSNDFRELSGVQTFNLLQACVYHAYTTIYSVCYNIATRSARDGAELVSSVR